MQRRLNNAVTLVRERNLCDRPDPKWLQVPGLEKDRRRRRKSGGGRLRRNIVVAIGRQELCTGARPAPSPAGGLRCIPRVGCLDDGRIGPDLAAGLNWNVRLV